MSADETHVTRELWEILVPTIRRVGGKPYTTRFHRVWDAKVRAIVGGLSVFPPIKGQWVSPDSELFIERMIPVRIACAKEQIDRIADMTASYYDQLAIMYYRISDLVVIKQFAGCEPKRGKECNSTSTNSLSSTK